MCLNSLSLYKVFLSPSFPPSLTLSFLFFFPSFIANHLGALPTERMAANQMLLTPGSSRRSLLWTVTKRRGHELSVPRPPRCSHSGKISLLPNPLRLYVDYRIKLITEGCGSYSLSFQQFIPFFSFGNRNLLACGEPYT